MFGARIGQRPGRYVCALTTAPGREVGHVDRQVQTQSLTEAEEPGEPATEEPPADAVYKTPMVYAEVFSTKGDAAEAVK